MSQKPRRRAQRKVVRIAGSHPDDVISQKELRQFSDLQAAEGMTVKVVQKVAFRLIARLARGATLETGEIVFDPQCGIVRTLNKCTLK